jgi:hypothetical protein
VRGGETARGQDVRGNENVERPRTDEAGVSAEGREQPVIEPQVETIPAPVAETPDTTPQQDAPSSDAAQDKKPRGGRQTKIEDTE